MKNYLSWRALHRPGLQQLEEESQQEQWHPQVVECDVAVARARGQLSLGAGASSVHGLTGFRDQCHVVNAKAHAPPPTKCSDRLEPKTALGSVGKRPMLEVDKNLLCLIESRLWWICSTSPGCSDGGRQSCRCFARDSLLVLWHLARCAGLHGTHQPQFDCWSPTDHPRMSRHV